MILAKNMEFDDIKTKFTRTRLAVIAWLLLGLIGIATLIRNLLAWNGWFTALVASAVFTDPKTSIVHVNTWLPWSISALVAATVVLGGLWIRSEINLKTARRRTDERQTIAFKTMLGMMWAATRIRDQHHPTAQKVKKSVRTVDISFRIDKQFGVTVEQKWSLYATAEPVNFWTISMRATAEAVPMEYLDDINFKVRDDSGNGVVYLPTENDQLAKKVVLYFLPQIEPGQSDRQIVFTYSWPGLFNQLKTKESENFNWTTESITDIETVRFLFLLEKGTGYALTAENLGPQHGASKPDAHQDGDNWSGFSYALQKIPAGKCQVGLLLKLKKA